MAADSLGNDIAAVGVPITGAIAWAPGATAALTPAAGAVKSLTLPTAFKKLGLIKTDGGFEWTLEPDGDPIDFYQDGYFIPSGLANASVDVTLAQTDENIRTFIQGKTADANGYMVIDAGGNASSYLIFVEEIFKNGVIRRRQGYAQVSAMKEDKSERGSVLGYGTTLTFRRDASFKDSLGTPNHLGEWLIPAS